MHETTENRKISMPGDLLQTRDLCGAVASESDSVASGVVCGSGGHRFESFEAHPTVALHQTEQAD